MTATTPIREPGTRAPAPAMKWRGWGDPGVEFTHEDKPGLAPFIREVLGIDVTRAGAAVPPFERLAVPDPDLPGALRAALERAADVSTDAHDRVEHGRLPDAVVRPADETAVAGVVRAVLDADAVLIPFGGGTSISGSLEPP